MTGYNQYKNLYPSSTSSTDNPIATTLHLAKDKMDLCVQMVFSEKFTTAFNTIIPQHLIEKANQSEPVDIPLKLEARLPD